MFQKSGNRYTEIRSHSNKGCFINSWFTRDGIHNNNNEPWWCFTCAIGHFIWIHCIVWPVCMHLHLLVWSGPGPVSMVQHASLCLIWFNKESDVNRMVRMENYLRSLLIMRHGEDLLEVRSHMAPEICNWNSKFYFEQDANPFQKKQNLNEWLNMHRTS